MIALAGRKIRRHVILFKDQFASLVRTGSKVQTIRPVRERVIEVDDVLSLRTWVGLPYRSKQRHLRDGICTSVLPILIRSMDDVVLNGQALTPMGITMLAKADGFDNAGEFERWFKEQHDLPFKGIMISWCPT